MSDPEQYIKRNLAAVRAELAAAERAAGREGTVMVAAVKFLLSVKACHIVVSYVLVTDFRYYSACAV